MASVLKVDKLDPQSGTTLELGTSGDTVSLPSGATLDISASTLTPPATMPASSAANLTSIPAANLTGTIAAISGTNLTNLPAANLTGTIAAISGANVTNLTAGNLSSGTVPTARLGSGTADATTFLSGAQTYTAAGGGKLLQVISHQLITSKEITSNVYTSTGLTLTITPANTANKILIIGSIWFVLLSSPGPSPAEGVAAIDYRLKRNIDSAGETLVHTIGDTQGLMSSDTDAVPYTQGRIDAMASINYIDSPSTASSTVYSIDFRNITNYSGCNINGAWSGGTGTSHPVSTIHALEIDGT